MSVPSPSTDSSAATLLTINAGSSTLKMAVYTLHDGERPISTAIADRIGIGEASITTADAEGTVHALDRRQLPDHAAAFRRSLDQLPRDDVKRVRAVGHRIVHGGPHHREPEIVTARLIAALRDLAPIDPDHMPIGLGLIEAAGSAFPNVPQVACFDTAFHRSMPRVARMYALPPQPADDRLSRYGFHGLSCESIVDELKTMAPATLPDRLIVAHLGNGASLSAVRGGVSVDTTMGFSPAGGLVMGTRSGDLDPSVLPYLARSQRLSLESLTRLVNKESGLLGVSGSSQDMRDLLAREGTDPRAADAIALFCYTARKFLGALVAVLGGLDVLVFTGGIGEHGAAIRARMCDGLECFGIALDQPRNAAHAAIISRDGTPVVVRVMRTDEDLVIAKRVRRLLGGPGGDNVRV